MHRPRRVRLFAAAAAATLLGALAVVMGPVTAAQASTVTVPYRCELTVLGITYDSLQSVPVTITAPSSSSAASALPVSYDIAAGSTPTNAGVAFTNAVIGASAGITATSPSATVAATAAAANTAPATIPAFGNFPTNLPVSMSFPPGTFLTGETVTIKPAVLQLSIVSGDDGIGGGSMICTPEPTPGPTGATVLMATGPSGATENYCAVISPATSCSSTQDLFGTVTAGTLSQVAFGTGTNPSASAVVFPPVETKAILTTTTAPFNRIQVTDTRGTQVGMSLVASVPANFTDGAGGTIPISGLRVTGLACNSAAAGSAPSVAGSGGSLSGAQLLCSTTTGVLNPQGSTSGQWDITGTWELDVPAYSKASAYNATVTFVLS